MKALLLSLVIALSGSFASAVCNQPSAFALQTSGTLTKSSKPQFDQSQTRVADAQSTVHAPK